LVLLDSETRQQYPNGKGDHDADQLREQKSARTPALQNLLECYKFTCTRRCIRVNNGNLRIKAEHKVEPVSQHSYDTNDQTESDAESKEVVLVRQE
jgi:hypothetical protein